ncbi:hypothetical protein J6590_018217 [Homalodisca vitripennis]|nr:hypothetical protein J6590_018217 [Homalodisca vitripennis]
MARHEGCSLDADGCDEQGYCTWTVTIILEGMAVILTLMAVANRATVPVLIDADGCDEQGYCTATATIIVEVVAVALTLMAVTSRDTVRLLYGYCNYNSRSDGCSIDADGCDEQGYCTPTVTIIVEVVAVALTLMAVTSRDTVRLLIDADGCDEQDYCTATATIIVEVMAVALTLMAVTSRDTVRLLIDADGCDEQGYCTSTIIITVEVIAVALTLMAVTSRATNLVLGAIPSAQSHDPLTSTEDRYLHFAHEEGRDKTTRTASKAAVPVSGHRVDNTMTTDSWCGEDKATRTANKAAVPVSGGPRCGYATVKVTIDSWCGEDKATRTASKAAAPVSGHRVDCG